MLLPVFVQHYRVEFCEPPQVMFYPQTTAFGIEDMKKVGRCERLVDPLQGFDDLHLNGM
jgi:hypothetical protein